MCLGTADPRRLNQVRVPIIDRGTCKKPNWYWRKFTDVMLCAGYPEGGKDSCQVGTWTVSLKPLLSITFSVFFF